MRWVGTSLRFSDDELYPGDYPVLLSRLRALDSGLHRAVLIGHNPGVAELAARLRGNATILREFRPGAAALFEVPAPWSDLTADNARLISAYAP